MITGSRPISQYRFKISHKHFLVAFKNCAIFWQYALQTEYSHNMIALLPTENATTRNSWALQFHVTGSELPINLVTVFFVPGHVY